MLSRRPAGARGDLPAEPRRRSGARWAALLAVVAGLVGAAAFPPFGWWPLAFVSVAAALGRRCTAGAAAPGAWLGLLYGLAFFVPLLHWTGVYVGAVPWLILAVAEAAFFAGLGALLPLVQRLPGSAGLGRPRPGCCRRRCATGCRSAASRGAGWRSARPTRRCAGSRRSAARRWSPSPSRWPAAPWPRSAPRVRAARWRRGERTRGRRASPCRCSARCWPGRCGPAPDRDSATTTVALIQGSVPDLGLAFEQRARQVLDNHVAETMKLAAAIRAGTVPRPSLVVWPENASDVDPFSDADGLRRDRRDGEGRSASRCWSARSCRARGRTTAATPASSGRRRPGRARSTSSGTRCRSASTSRCAASPSWSAPTSSWSPRTWSPGTATGCSAAARSRSAT